MEKDCSSNLPPRGDSDGGAPDDPDRRRHTYLYSDDGDAWTSYVVVDSRYQLVTQPEAR